MREVREHPRCKVGLLYQGRVRNHLYVQGSWRDSLLYAAVNRNL